MDSENSSLKIQKFKIALCQLHVTNNKEENIAHARRSIEDAADNGAKLVLLPEMWNCPYSSENFPKYAEDRITIVGGSIPERKSGRLYNTCFVFGPDGTQMAKHRKLHLFDVNMPGDITFKESDTLSAGHQPTVVKTDVGCIGLGICHDLRFPELAMLYRTRGAHLICYPGAFNLSTGQMLWELMQRARAADNQLFVATCSPCRDSKGDYTIWGHSSLVGPFGEIIATSGPEETTVFAEIDYSHIQARRMSLPRQQQEDMYKLVDIVRGE